MANPRKMEQEPVVERALRERAIEQWAETQIDRLIDPDTSQEERQRRIHRLTEGPPEFVDLRIDLPGRRRI